MQKTVRLVIEDFIQSSSTSTVITTHDNRIAIKKVNDVIVITVDKPKNLARGRIRVRITNMVTTLINGNVTILKIGTTGFIMAKRAFLNNGNDVIGVTLSKLKYITIK